MLTVLVIVAIWVVLSLPLSVVLGASLRDDTRLELVGMDGDVAIFRGANGALERVSLADRASH
jgi:hypothetical protein